MFGWRITRVDGNSMSPSLGNGDYVVSRRSAAEPGDIILFEHNGAGRMIKRVVARNDIGQYIVRGENILSSTSDSIGPVKPENILGTVRWRISPAGLNRVASQQTPSSSDTL